jgi:hypothetical protein
LHYCLNDFYRISFEWVRLFRSFSCEGVFFSSAYPVGVETFHVLVKADSNGRGKEFSVNLLGIPPFFVQGKHYPVPRKEEGC